MEGGEIGSPRSIRMPWLFWPFYLIGVAWLGLLSWGSYGNGAWIGVKVTAVFAGFVVLAPVVWAVADWLRQAAMPTMFFSRGFFDTLFKKLFWAVGPQVIGLCVAIVGCSWLVFQIVPDRSKPRPVPEIASPRTPSVGAERRAPETPRIEDQVATVKPPAPSVAPQSDLCLSPAVLKAATRAALDDIFAEATLGKGHTLDRTELERGTRVKLSEVKQVGDRYGEEGTRFGCTAFLAVEVYDEELETKGVAASIEETAFVVEAGPDGTLDIYFPND